MKLTLIPVLFIILLCRNINFTNAAEYTIYLVDSGFSPQSTTANVGDTVTFWDAAIVDKFNSTGVRQIVQAEGDASACVQSTVPGAFSFSISSTSPKSTVSIASAGTISFFSNGQCQKGFWGSIVVNGPISPLSPINSTSSSENSTSSAKNLSPSEVSSSNSNSTPLTGNPSPITPYIDPIIKSPKLEPWKLALIIISSVSVIALMVMGTYFIFKSKSEKSKVTTDNTNVDSNNNPNVDSNKTNVDSNNVDSNNVDSNNVDSNNVDSNNVDSNNVDSNNVDSNNVDSNNVDSNNVDSNTSNVDSNNSNSNINANNDNNV